MIIFNCIMVSTNFLIEYVKKKVNNLMTFSYKVIIYVWSKRSRLSGNERSAGITFVVKNTASVIENSYLPLFFDFLSNFVDFFSNSAPGFAFPSFIANIFMMAKAMFTPPWTFRFLFCRRVQTTHMVFTVAIAAT